MKADKPTIHMELSEGEGNGYMYGSYKDLLVMIAVIIEHAASALSEENIMMTVAKGLEQARCKKAEKMVSESDFDDAFTKLFEEMFKR